MSKGNLDYLHVLCIYIVDNCTENKVQSVCQGLSRCEGEVRIQFGFRRTLYLYENIKSNDIFIFAGVMAKTGEKSLLKTNNQVTLNVNMHFLFLICSDWLTLFVLIWSYHVFSLLSQ